MNRTAARLLGLLSISCAGLAGMASLPAFGGPAEEKAQDKKPDAAAAEFFETKVRPVLANNCFGCHGDKKQMGSLRLDSLVSMLKGNSGGPVVVAGHPEKSPLLQVVHYDGKVKMPPAGKLKPEEIAALTEWVRMGAPWPGTKVSDAATLAAKSGEYVITPEQRKFWSFRPVAKPAVPAVKLKAWVRNPVDNFILARIEKKGITPSAMADRRTLIRRATFDLTGLPPTAEEIDAFLADKSPNAFANVVDRLLASPRYGERWARLWLDVARYADNKGYVFVDDREYHNGYTYRDYVIRAFNEDLPYDQFIIQQLAADHLNFGDDKRPLAAMGFLTLGRRFLNNQPDIIDDRIDVTTRGFLGLTAGCARCHDHKFDPIPTKDYYSLYGVFASSIEPNPAPAISPKEISEPYEKHNAQQREAVAQRERLIQSQIGVLRNKVAAGPDSVAKPVRDVLQALRIRQLPNDGQLNTLRPAFEPDAAAQIVSLEQTLEKLKGSTPPAPEFACSLADAPDAVEPYVFVRGNPGNRGPQVPRRFFAILSGDERKPFTKGSGRLELAQSIASRDNPLTARVMVNRIWRHHFGQGIVRTPSDFGTRGEPPTHPELLDYLASRFMEEGWSVKKLHRLIMLSSAYQQSSDIDPKSFTADPENRLVWHMNRRRLDLEQTRDSVLFVAGELEEKVGGRSVQITTNQYSKRRTMYGYIDRQNLQGLYRTFDLASPDSSSPQRFTTTVPQQALFMMNSPFVVQESKALAKRKEFESCKDDAERIKTAYRIVFGRAPLKDELQVGGTYLRQPDPRTALISLEAEKTKKPETPALTQWERYLQALLMTNEFSFVD